MANILVFIFKIIQHIIIYKQSTKKGTSMCLFSKVDKIRAQHHARLAFHMVLPQGDPLQDKLLKGHSIHRGSFSFLTPVLTLVKECSS